MLFDRGYEHVWNSIPMNIMYLTVTIRTMLANPAAFLTYGICGCSQAKNRSKEKHNVVLENEASVPHVWYMIVQLTVVLLYGNSEINSRVASTLPIYYWVFASLITENKGKGMNLFARLACMHNLGYLILNFVYFVPENYFF